MSAVLLVIAWWLFLLIAGLALWVLVVLRRENTALYRQIDADHRRLRRALVRARRILRQRA